MEFYVLTMAILSSKSEEMDGMVFGIGKCQKVSAVQMITSNKLEI